LARGQISWVGPVGFGFYIPSIRIQFFLSFVNRQTRIVSGVGLVIRPVVGYALDNDFGIISTGESAFGGEANKEAANQVLNIGEAIDSTGVAATAIGRNFGMRTNSDVAVSFASLGLTQNARNATAQGGGPGMHPRPLFLLRQPSDYNPSVPATCLRFPPNRCNPFRIALSLMAADGYRP
jgi:hypothetical protein